MIAVDANVIIRFLVRDEPLQANRAESLIRGTEIWLCKTVLLETEWVLRSTYGYPPDVLAKALQALVRLPTIRLEDESAIVKALEWFEAGLDFADALHLASAGKAQQYATFDLKFVNLTKGTGGIETVIA